MKNPHLSLPPRDQTGRGPILRLECDELIVDYDHDAESGRKWSRLVFRDVLAAEYRQFAACRGEDIVLPTEVHQIDESPWLSNVLAVWRESVGWHEWQRHLGGPRRFKHFTASFDNAGTINIVAMECRTTNVRPPSA